MRSDHLRSAPSKTKRGTKSEDFGHTSSRGRNDDTTNVEIPTDMGKDDEERAMRLQRRNVQKKIINNDQREIIDNQREVEKDAHPEGGVKEIPKSNIIADETTMNSSEIFCYEAMYPEADADIQDPLLAYKAVSDPDTMYLHQALKEDDKDEFIKAMRKEIHDQSENGNFSVIHKSQVPEGKNALPAVWQMNPISLHTRQQCTLRRSSAMGQCIQRMMQIYRIHC